MAEQQGRRPSSGRRGRPSRLAAVIQFFQNVWLGFWWYLSAPYRFFSEAAARRRRRAQAGAGGGKGSLFRQIRYYLFLPFALAAAGFARVFSGLGWWYQSTSARFFLQALPAIIVGLGATAVTAVAYFKPIDKVISRYERAGATSMAEKNYTVARICYERLVNLEGEKPELLYRLALAEAGVSGDESPRAYALMDEIAPDNNKQGELVEAHIWKGNRLLAIDPPTPQSLQLAFTHFKHALAKRPDSTEAHAGIYEIFMKTGQYAQAQQHLPYASRFKPELAVIFLRTQLASKPDVVKPQLETLRDSYKQKLAEDPDNKEIRIALAEAHRLLDDYPAAEQVLVEGTELSNNQEKDYHTALANLYMIQLQVLSAQKKINGEGQLRLVQAVLDHDPTHVFMLQRLYAMAEGEGDAAEKAREMMRRAIATGQAQAATLHMIQGNYWFGKGKPEKARIHLEQGYRLNPNLPELANNFAWIIATTPPFDAERALKIIDTVIENAPDVAQYRDTRGQILVRMARYKEALPDLEFALRSMPTSRSVHRALETCYRNLDMEEMAQQHKLICDKLTEEISRLRMEQANKKWFELPTRKQDGSIESVADDERMDYQNRQKPVAQPAAKEGEEKLTLDTSGTDPATPTANGDAAKSADGSGGGAATPPAGSADAGGNPPAAPAAPATPPTDPNPPADVPVKSGEPTSGPEPEPAPSEAP